MTIVKLPDRTQQQLREFKRLSTILYNDYQYARNHTEKIAESELVESLGPVFELLRQLSDSYTESDEPGEDIPEVTKIMSESFVPNILDFRKHLEECWISLQAAVGLDDEVAADVALEILQVRLLDSGLAEKMQHDINRLKELGL